MKYSMSQLKRAFNIKRNLGAVAANGYMNNRAWPWYSKLYVKVMP